MKRDVIPTTPPSLREGLHRFVTELGLDALIDDVDAGLDHLEGEIAAVALDLHRAELRGATIAEAARDEFGCPNLYRLHTVFSDILTTVLDPTIRAWAAHVLRAPPIELLHDLEVGLARAAIDPVQPRFVRLLARLALWESVRLGLLFLDHLGGDDNLYARGLNPAQLDALAETEVLEYLDLARERAEARDGVTTQTILASALLVLRAHEREVRMMVSSAALLVEWERRAKWEHRLRRLDRRDDLLIRNKVGLDGEEVSMERLIARHPVAFGDSNANREYVRRHRLLDGEHPPRSREERGEVALVDLLKDEVLR